MDRPNHAPHQGRRFTKQHWTIRNLSWEELPDSRDQCLMMSLASLIFILSSRTHEVRPRYDATKFQYRASPRTKFKLKFKHLLGMASPAKDFLAYLNRMPMAKPFSRPCIHTLHPLGRQQCRRHHTPQRNTPRKIQHGINIPIPCPLRRTIPVQ